MTPSPASPPSETPDGTAVAGQKAADSGPTRADAIAGLIFVILGALIAIESWRMPRMEQFGSSIWSAPGVVPGMIGIALAVMGIALFARSRTALAEGPSGIEAEQGGWRRVAITLFLCLVFAGGLIGLIPFALAAFLFIAAFALYFDLADRRVAGDPPADRALMIRVLVSLTIAAVGAFAITTIFQDIFLVRLP